MKYLRKSGSGYVELSAGEELIRSLIQILVGLAKLALVLTWQIARLIYRLCTSTVRERRSESRGHPESRSDVR